MRGVGGPLLCISDLLSDVGEENSGVPHDQAPPLDAADVSKLPASELPKLFQVIISNLTSTQFDAIITKSRIGALHSLHIHSIFHVHDP